MIDQPDDSAVTLDNILAPHRQRTVQRMMAQDMVLCIQDGSELNYTNLDKCQGLGVFLKAQCIAPKEKSQNDKRKPSAIPIEEKKTFVWIEHHRDLVELSKELPQTRLINVCDREADFFELLDEQRQNPSQCLSCSCTGRKSTFMMIYYMRLQHVYVVPLQLIW